ncbi:MAG: adenylate/guanylate cyclase domain-containing protein [Bacteroidota bacterium]
MTNSKKRKLRAILFADIVGYTALMQKDETQASRLLQKFRYTLNEKVGQYAGEIINNYGDGCLCTFESAVDAMTCAKTIQLIFQAEPKVPVRIGLHSGDVFFEDNNVFGDSVNIASRIESLGVAGAVLFSKRIKRDIDNQTIFDVAPVGEFEFKNVNKSMEVFALANDGFVVPKKSEMRGKVKPSTPTKTKSTTYLRWVLSAILVSILAGVLFFFNQNQKYPTTIINKENIEQMEKSIAVLPFRDLSPQQDQIYFADGMVEAIRSKLAQIGNLRVTSMTSVLIYRDNPKPIPEIAKELKVQHILEGTVYRDKDKVRIIAQLIDADTDEHLWAETYDEQITDVFAIQSKIATVVSKALQAKLTPAEQLQLATQLSTNIAAYDFYLSAKEDLRNWVHTRDTSLITIADSKLQKAIAIDASYDDFYVEMGNVWYIRQFVGYGESALDSVLAYTQKALYINGLNDESHSLQAKTYWLKGRFELSKNSAKKALEITPNNQDALWYLAGYYQGIEKDYEKAIPLLLKTIALNPNNTSGVDENRNMYQALGGLFIEIDELEKAEVVFKKYYELHPNSRLANSTIGAVLKFQQKFTESLPFYERQFELGNRDFRSTDDYAFILMTLGNYKEALQQYERLNQMVETGFQETAGTHTFRHRYAFVLWQLGRKAAAQRLFDQHIQAELAFIEKGTRMLGQEYDLAGVYAFLGEKEKAYQMLEKMPYWYVTYQLLKFDPLFDSLRDEPRFQRIQQKLEQEVAQMRAQAGKYQTEGGFMFSVE